LPALLGEAAAEVARANGDRRVRSQVAEMMTSMLDALAAR
jgi:hypothetical protein